MLKEHRYSEAAKSDDELPLPQGVSYRVQVTKWPATAVLTSLAKPRFKVHKQKLLRSKVS
jgi:hypothetical protein